MDLTQRNELLQSRRWKIEYTYPCLCAPRCYWAKDGLHGLTTYLNGGEEKEGAAAAAEITARTFRHTDLADIRMWQESERERDDRLEQTRRTEADEARGIWWGMGGAN